MSGTGIDHYAVLGIGRDADEAAVRRAYFRLVRRHTPEDDPEMFRAVSEAYRVLTDPEERRAYDHAEGSPAFRAGVDAAYELLATDKARARIVADRLLDSFGDRREVLLTIAVLYLRADASQQAVPLLQALHKDDPGKAGILAWLGVAYRELGQFAQSERAFRAALAIDGTDVDIHVALCDTYLAQGRLDDALNVLEEAIRADGRVDMADVQLFMRKLWLLGARRDWRALVRTVGVVERLAPVDDQDARAFLTAQFRLLAKKFADADADDLARFAMDASELVRDDPRLQRVADLRSDDGRLREEIERFETDRRVADWVRNVVDYAFRDQHTPTGDQRFVANLRSILRSFAHRVPAEWSAFAAKYPLLASIAAHHYEMVRAPSPKRTRARKPDRAACAAADTVDLVGAFVVMAVLCTVVGLVFGS